MHTAQAAAETAAVDGEEQRRGDHARRRCITMGRRSPTTGGTDAYLTTATGTGTGYTLTVTSVATGDKFTLARAANGTLTRSCTIPTKTSRPGGCHHIKGTKGTW